MPKIRVHGTASKPKSRKKNPATTAIHGAHIDGIRHVVGIGDLRVVIIPDGDQWFAQGLEIDYAAQGKTIADVKKRFSDGLCATIHEHLRVYNSIEKMLRVAPPEVWAELYYSETAKLKLLSQESMHLVMKAQDEPHEQVRLPFPGISFLERQAL